MPFRDDLPPFVSGKLARCLPRCRTEVASVMSIASALAKPGPDALGSRRDPVARSPCARTGSVARLAGQAEDASDPSLTSPYVTCIS
jgi:hypothetical protein